MLQSLLLKMRVSGIKSSKDALGPRSQGSTRHRGCLGGLQAALYSVWSLEPGARKYGQMEMQYDFKTSLKNLKIIIIIIK